MNRYLILFAIAFASLLAWSPTAAQDAQPEDNPLLAMLAMTPAQAALGEDITVTYTDFQALYTSREGLPEVNSSMDFDLFSDEERSLWISNTRRLASGPPFMRNFN